MKRCTRTTLKTKVRRHVKKMGTINLHADVKHQEKGKSSVATQYNMYFYVSIGDKSTAG